MCALQYINTIYVREANENLQDLIFIISVVFHAKMNQR
jgi:hypothetical protein